ncbi:MAG: nicotinamide-nucleotide amidohydrolase family protein, partial [Deltaproteobacteria bacterium]|nr:nicotinamide-nucleotide amidohydrolase family protein [Deltaproteobacteria bacterium]
TALKRRFEQRGRPWTENNLKQARFPEGAKVIPNPRGTAPGFRIEVAKNKWLIWLSGVPREMVEMMQNSVLPWISESLTTGDVASHTFKVYGLTESKLDDILKPVQLPETAQLSFRAHYPDLSLRLVFRGGKEDSEPFQDLKSRIGELIEPYVYGEGDQTLEEIVGQLLLDRQWTVALAESCTGGYTSHRLTRVPGSSNYFKGSAVTYSNEAKMDVLGVKKSTIDGFGPVSQQTAMEMAEGIRSKMEADIGMSVTGVAGPDGGTPETPVGTVWIGLALSGSVEAQLFNLQGDRERVVQGASQAVLHWLRKVLL